MLCATDVYLREIMRFFSPFWALTQVIWAFAPLVESHADLLIDCCLSDFRFTQFICGRMLFFCCDCTHFLCTVSINLTDLLKRREKIKFVCVFVYNSIKRMSSAWLNFFFTVRDSTDVLWTHALVMPGLLYWSDTSSGPGFIPDYLLCKNWKQKKATNWWTEFLSSVHWAIMKWSRRAGWFRH